MASARELLERAPLSRLHKRVWLAAGALTAAVVTVLTRPRSTEQVA